MSSQTKPKISDDVFSEFRHWAPELQERILSESSVMHLEDAQTVYLEGDISKHLYLILSGEIKIATYDQDGSERIFEFLKPGNIFGELGALDNLPRESAAISVSTSSVLSIPKIVFFTALQSVDFKAWLDLIKIICARRRGLYQKSGMPQFDHVTRRVALKVLELQKQNNSQIIKIRHEDLASFVQADRSAVSRALQELEALGCLRKARGHIVIDEKENLKRYVEGK